MKNLLKSTVLGVSFTAVFSIYALALVPNVVAKVNGKDVTRAEIEKSLSQITTKELGGQEALEKLPADFQKAFIEKYIEKQLIIEQAKKEGYANDPDVKQKLKDAEDMLVQQKYLMDVIKKNKNESKLREMYDEKVKSKAGKQEAHAYHILVKTEAEAKEIREKITKGENFEKLAKEKSIDPGAKMNGGDLDYFTADKMVPDFSQATFALKKNEISQPVKTQFGWHIIKVVDFRTATVPTFEQAKATLESQLESQIIVDEVKKIKKDAEITWYGPYAKAEKKPVAAAKPLTVSVPGTQPAEQNKSEPLAATATPAKPEAKKN